MNARHAYELVRLKFPTFIASAHEWEIVASGGAEEHEQVLAFLIRSFSESEVVVRVTRKLGGQYSLLEAAQLIAEHLGKAEVRIANRQFTQFAVVGTPGVATAWAEESMPKTTGHNDA